MKKIDNITLASYLDGTLSDNEREEVENAIENDEELKSVIDDWVSMADDVYFDATQNGNTDYRMEACRSINAVMDSIKDKANNERVAAAQAATPVYDERRIAAAKPKYIFRKVLVAASLITFVGVTVLWLFNSSGDNSTQSFGSPMNGEYLNHQPTPDTFTLDTMPTLNDYSNLYK